MKRFLSLFLIMILLLTVTACDGTTINISPEAAKELGDVVEKIYEEAQAESKNAAADEDAGEEAKEAAAADDGATVAKEAAAVKEAGAEAGSAEDKQIIEEVLKNFEGIAAIPRPSLHEKQISDYMVKWAKERGYETVQDKYNNVYITIPADKGRENDPVFCLQGHLDMVVAVEDGYAFDPEKDSIKIVNDGKTLTAEHTSLGADDGIGLAIAMYMADHMKDHGKIKLLFTADEEVGNTGAINADPEFFGDVDYLFNLDAPSPDEIFISSASMVKITAEKKPESVKPKYDNPVEIRIEGGLGGHSALELETGRVYAITALADLLTELEEAGIPFEIASYTGGSAHNAIPASAKVLLMTDYRDYEKINDTVDAFMESLKATYGKNDPDITSFVGVTNSLVEAVLTESEKKSLLTYCLNAFSGIYSYSYKHAGLVAASANLAIIDATAKNISIISSVRSSENIQEKHLLNAYRSLAELCGFKAETERSCYAWPIDEDNDLAGTLKESYEQLTGKEAILTPTHAGQECGALLAKNPKMKMAALGPELKDEHSIAETLTISDIPIVVKMIEMTMRKLSK